MTTAEAAEALAAWGGGPPPRLIKDRENAVYEVYLTDGTHAALRLHRPGYQSADAIRSELIWTGGLATAGLPVPRPVPGAQGALIHTLTTGRVASVVEWVAGRPLGEAWTPLPGAPAEQANTFHRIGALLARLHAATDALTLPPGFTRPAWDEDGLLGDSPLWGRFWENPALTMPERATLDAARSEARARLQALRPGADYGLIHADLMRENLLVDGPTLRLIDFDDSGFGFRLYDLGTLMIQNLDEPAYPDLLAAAAAGYASLRPLDAPLIPMFVMLRCLASCGWAVPRLPPGSPRLRDYATRAVRQAEAFLAAT
ncbi:MAG: phosphotransferase [Rhodobacteraceae bacterium]|nr:phosphotransferase [Paracoccaceae bacterium]